MIHGLRIGTDISLPAARSSGRPDLRLEVSAEPTGVDGACVLFADPSPTLDRPWFRAWRCMGTQRGHVEFGTAGSLSIDGQAGLLRFHRSADVPDELIGLFVVGAGLATVLALAGRCVLHASAVAVDGRAIAFVGSSGGGKSTLAAAACAGGAELISDDVLRLDPGRGDGWSAYRGTTRIRLRDGRAQVADALPAGSPDPDGRLTVCPPVAQATTRLAGLVVFDETPGEHHPRRVHGRAALMALLPHHRLAGLCDPEALTAHLEASARLSRDVPMVAVSASRVSPEEQIDSILRLIPRTS